MAHYLRDEKIANLSVTAENLTQISAVFSDRANTLNADIVEGEVAGIDKRAFLTYIVRFDNKGYRVFNLDDLLRYFSLAKKVERIIFTVETGESMKSNRQNGTYLDLRLDGNDPSTCFLAVTSDDKDWVDASFSAVQDVLAKCKSRSGWVRTTWTQFAVQIVGVTLGFILSLWAAAKIAPHLKIESAFVIAFLFVLLIFSNVWTHLNENLLWILNAAFPNIKFFRSGKERLHWLGQAIVGAVVVGVVVYVLGAASNFLLEVIGSIAGK